MIDVFSVSFPTLNLANPNSGKGNDDEAFAWYDYIPGKGQDILLPHGCHRSVNYFVVLFSEWACESLKVGINYG